MAPDAVLSRPEGKGDFAVAPSAPLALEYLVHGDGVCPGLRYEYLGMAVVATQPIGVYGMGEHDISHERDFGFDEYVEAKRRLFFNAGIKGALRVDITVHDGCRPVHIPGRVLGQGVEGADIARASFKYGPV